VSSAVVSVLSYLGVGLTLAGVLAWKPGVAAAGLALALTGAWWPWPMRRGRGDAQIDAFVPEFQFSERHALGMRAEVNAVDRALRAVTAGEIRFFRTLTTIRSPRLPGRPRQESILQPTWDAPILDVATRSGFLWLSDQPVQEVVVGMVVAGDNPPTTTATAFRDLARPGVAKAAMNFRIELAADGSVGLTTETRIVATSVRARRAFGLYWAFIYPGSSLIRYGWLAAIRRRAENPNGC
jgi:hypothetical protein